MSGAPRVFRAHYLWLMAAVLFSVRHARAARPTGEPANPTRAVNAYFQEVAVSIHKSTFANGMRVVLKPQRDRPFIAAALTFAADPAASASKTTNVPLALYLNREALKFADAPAHRLLRKRFVDTSTRLAPDHFSFIVNLPASELPFALWFAAGLAKGLQALETRLPEFLVHASDPAPEGAVRRSIYNDLLAPTTERAVQRPGASFFASPHMVLTLVGDFETDTALTLVRRYFDVEEGGPPAQSARLDATSPHDLDNSTQPQAAQSPQSPRKAAYDWLGLALPATTTLQQRIMWQLVARLVMPPERGQPSWRSVPSAEGHSFDLSHSPTRGALIFRLDAGLQGDTTRAQRELLQRLRQLRERAPSQSSLHNAKQALIVDWLKRFLSFSESAALLGEFEACYGDARLVARMHAELTMLSSSELWQAIRNSPVPDEAVVQPAPGSTAQ